MKDDNISELSDHDTPFCEQQYMHESCYMSLFDSNHLISLILPKLPQILDIYSVVALKDPSYGPIMILWNQHRLQTIFLKTPFAAANEICATILRISKRIFDEWTLKLYLGHITLYWYF